MEIQFFDEPGRGPRRQEDVRIKQIGLFIYDDLRRLAFGVELTPFLERPSVEVRLRNGKGEPAGSLNVIDTLRPNFSLTLHLRDAEPAEPYELTAVLYYATPETERKNVDQRTVTFSADEPGEQLFKFEIES